jgi:hypothetical protein
MIFFIERARLGDLEIFLKFKIRIAEINKIRSTKFEIRNKFKILMFKIQNKSTMIRYFRVFFVLVI